MPDRARHLRWYRDTKLGRRKSRAKLARRLSRATTSLCPISIVVNMPLLPYRDVPVGFLRVICTEECAESHQSEKDNFGGKSQHVRGPQNPWMRRMQPYWQPLRAPVRPASRSFPLCPTCLVPMNQELSLSQSHTAGHVENVHYKRLLHITTRLSLMFSLESCWCRVLSTSAERTVTGRQDNAIPRRTRDPNEKRNVNCWHNLKSATRPLSKY